MELERRKIQLGILEDKSFWKQLFDNKATWLKHKIVRFKQEVLETLLHGCLTI